MSSCAYYLHMETAHLTNAPHHPDRLPAAVFNPAGNPDEDRAWHDWCEAHPWLVEVEAETGEWEPHEVIVRTPHRPMPVRFVELRYAHEAEALDAIAEIATSHAPEELIAVRAREDGTDNATVLVLSVVHALAGLLERV